MNNFATFQSLLMTRQDQAMQQLYTKDKKFSQNFQATITTINIMVSVNF